MKRHIRIAEVDVLLCSTAAPRPVENAEHIRPSVEKRGDRPLCILDIAPPRCGPRGGRLERLPV